MKSNNFKNLSLPTPLTSIITVAILYVVITGGLPKESQSRQVTNYEFIEGTRLILHLVDERIYLIPTHAQIIDDTQSGKWIVFISGDNTDTYSVVVESESHAEALVKRFFTG